MSCRDACRAMKEALDMRLDYPREESIRCHLETCERCRREWDELRKLDTLLRDGPAVDIPEDVADRLVGTLASRGEALARQRGQYPRRAWRYALGAAGLAVAVAIGIVLATAPRTDVLAAVVEAMEQVKTAHIVGRLADTGLEVWISADHGMRYEWEEGLRISTSEATWDYDARNNNVAISDPDPDALKRALAELSGSRWLVQVSSQHQYQVSDVVIDGKAAKRIDISFGESQGSGIVWIDAGTMRVFAIEAGRIGDDGQTVEERLDIEYDVTIDPVLFSFTTPARATVVDTRLGPLQELIDDALEIARTTPIHEVSERKASLSVSSELCFDYPATSEAWWLHGVGSRVERLERGQRHVRVRKGQTIWRSDSRSVFVEETSDEVEEARPCIWLYEFRRNFPRAVRPPELTYKERDGTQVAEVARYYTFHSPICEYDPAKGHHVRTGNKQYKQKELLVFDLGARTLVERARYWDVEGEWRLGEYAKYEYLDRLPEDVFKFEPPPGLEIKDLR